MKPKILLVAINAKYIHSNPAIYSLRGYALSQDASMESNIELGEYTINNQMENILADIYLKRPDVIGISCYIWNIQMVGSLLPELRKVLPDVKIWLGGPEVSYDAEKTMQRFPQIDGVFVGEGEVSFYRVCQYYIHAIGKLEEIPGIYYQGSIKQLQPLTDLDSLPFLYEHIEDFKNRIIYYETSRGCPFRCSYCLSSIDKTVRFRSFSLVKKELQFFLDHEVKQVKFVDRTFNCNKKHAMEIWQYIKEHDNGITNFHFEVAADILTEEEIELLLSMRPGAVQLEIGVQSTNPKTIAEIHRVMDFEKVKEITLRIHEAGNVHAHLDLIAGLPYEDYASFANSFNDVFSCKPEQLQLGFLKVLKGSYMYEMAEEYKIAYTNEPPYEVLFTNWLSFEEVLLLKQIEEMVELYYNSNQYTHILPLLLCFFDTPFEMFEALAHFYEKNGYFIKTPARMYRYQVLLSFALQVAPQWKDLFEEVFTFDAYLRENLKARPEFCKDLLEYKQALRKIGNQNKGNHVDVFHYPVWKYKNIQKEEMNKIQREEKPYFVVFHYEDRNKLTYEANISLEEPDLSES